MSLVKRYPHYGNHEVRSHDHDELTLQLTVAKNNDESVLTRLQGLSNTELGVSSLAKELCLLVVQEWLEESTK